MHSSQEAPLEIFCNMRFDDGRYTAKGIWLEYEAANSAIIVTEA